jgi:mannose-6-phosphate isomerase-like protein (cupin superfamily)
MARSPIILKPEEYEPALNVIGTSVTVLASDRETQGQEFTYQSGGEGAGPPPHSHEWDESFFVVKGTVAITCDGKTVVCTPGTLAFVPGGTIHSFKYGSDGGEMLEVTGVGSAAVQMFSDLSAEIPAGPLDVERVVDVMARSGATVHL